MGNWVETNKVANVESNYGFEKRTLDDPQLLKLSQLGTKTTH